MIDISWLKKNNCIIFETISGSRAYGLDTSESDTDIKGVFILPEHEFYSLEYVDQVNNETNDVVYYELKKFMDLLLKNNPNTMELLNMPPGCVLFSDPLYDEIRKDLFISKLCENTFANYAISQIKKAKGLHKKIMNPMEKERKTPLDFCYILENEKSIILRVWLKKKGLRQEQCGLVSMNHAEEIYALYYDEKEEFGFSGVLQKANANNVALSSVPEKLVPEAYMVFNHNAYKVYCKKYSEYWDWVSKRNEARYENTIAHGKNYDAKNVMHTFRLLLMAKDIAVKNEIVVRRDERDYLLSIKKGEFSYDELLEKAEHEIEKIHGLFLTSDLPEKPDENFVNDLLIRMRSEFYRRFRQL